MIEIQVTKWHDHPDPLRFSKRKYVECIVPEEYSHDDRLLGKDCCIDGRTYRVVGVGIELKRDPKTKMLLTVFEIKDAS